MNLLNPNIVSEYKSNSQKARVMTEFWTGENIFCPSCGSAICHYNNNKPVADFYCDSCNEDYELKSGKSLGTKIADGAYDTMISRLQDYNNPNFFFLNYKINHQITNFVVIPKHYFTPEIIEKRKPLLETAKRAGWVGCNVLLSGIPESGKIFYIKNGENRDKNDVLNDWNKTLFLREKKLESKGWILDIMKCIEMLKKKEFTLQEVYNFEPILKQKYPNNNFIKDKIRQQLQFLRDKEYLEFVSNGKYRVL
ncbi:MAG: DpnI domain-containing protein [Candidatus Gracilibacteria bacterium]|nr:DpnI domain-containing protein [Candidatus Gracilibacteria bacterium]